MIRWNPQLLNGPNGMVAAIEMDDFPKEHGDLMGLKLERVRHIIYKSRC